MSIKKINQFPDGSGTLTNDDIFLVMDNPSGSGVTKQISLSTLSSILGGGGSSGMSDIVQDTTPQLGGNLDLNTNNIVGTGNININGNITSASGSLSRLSFNTSVADPVLTQGQLSWDATEGTLNLGITNTHAQHIGEELHYRVRNNTASTLLKGTAVYASGLTVSGNTRIEIAPFVADGYVREVKFMGLVTEDISTGINGYTTHYGHIHALDTRGDAAANGITNKIWATGEPTWAAGDILYVHPTVAGKLTKIEPQHSISVAIILNRHQTQGKLFVRPISYGHLEDNHDVAISGATNGQFLQYNSATDYWVPSSSGNFITLQVNGTGVSVSGHTHTVSNITDLQTALNLKVNSTEVNTDLVGGPGISISYNSSNDSLSVYSNNENYITSLGAVSGSTPINYDPTSRSIQTLTLDGSATTFTKGTGWPTSSGISIDTVLRITGTSATSITWTIVNDWFSQPPAGALTAGTHLFLLRAIGSSIVEGHYIGSKTN